VALTATPTVRANQALFVAADTYRVALTVALTCSYFLLFSLSGSPVGSSDLQPYGCFHRISDGRSERQPYSCPNCQPYSCPNRQPYSCPNRCPNELADTLSNFDGISTATSDIIRHTNQWGTGGGAW